MVVTTAALTIEDDGTYQLCTDGSSNALGSDQEFEIIGRQNDLEAM